ncbi:aromatic motif membrane protein [Mycoplasma capricolum]|uniref:aromatic motif membrane protein n=1 Tax=Mycoplasma capricolum TaxID=2095 RepID=UPI003DA4453C
MKKYKKYIYIFISLITALLTSLVTYFLFSNKKESVNKIELKLEDKKAKWDLFLNYDYVDMLLNLVYKDQKEKQDYIEQQKSISTNRALAELKDYLSYANGVVANYSYDDLFDKNNEPILRKENSKKLDDFFKNNWLWTLFNIDKFQYVLFDISDQFINQRDQASINSQKDSLNYNAFKKIESNHMQQVVLEQKDKDNYKMYLLSTDWNILTIDINKKEEKFIVEINTYIHIHPDFYKNLFDPFLHFDLKKYVKGEILHLKSAKDQTHTKYNEQFGGKPLRLVMINIDNEIEKL